jgi:hypothetical protein
VSGLTTTYICGAPRSTPTARSCTPPPIAPCHGLAGTALSKCSALQRERAALTQCAKISTKTIQERKRRAACVATAKLAYRRAIAVIACSHFKNARKRATCIASAHRLR